MPTRLLTTATVLLVGVMILIRAPPMTLSGIDAACYARIARDLAERPLSTWLDVRWTDGPFYEHPPLGLWLEALWFSLFGSSAAAAVWLARVYSLLLAVVVWWGARSIAGPLTAVLSLIGLTSLASFQRESQNPMLELPLMLACAIALVCCGQLRGSWRWTVGFALAVTAAVWIKGVVGFAPCAGLLWAWWRDKSLRRPLAAFALSGLLIGLSVAGFEFIRRATGLAPYVEPYLNNQVLVAFLEGRYTRDPSPWFHLPTLVRWHVTALLALPVVALGWRGQSLEWKQLAVLGAGWMFAVVVPFSLAQQKSEWHLNILIPGAAWLIGAALASLPSRLLRVAPFAIFASILAWGIIESKGNAPANLRHAAIIVVTTTPAELDGAPVANCSPVSPWVAQHLFAFHWNGTAAACEADVPWHFDGTALTFQK